MIPAGWDSWGKIEVLKEGFNCREVNGLWEAALGREARQYTQKNSRNADDGLLQDKDDDDIEGIWQDVIPDPANDPLVSRADMSASVGFRLMYRLCRRMVILRKESRVQTNKTF